MLSISTSSTLIAALSLKKLREVAKVARRTREGNRLPKTQKASSFETWRFDGDI